jgi:hypothetical protein
MLRGETPLTGAFGYGNDFYAREFWRFVMVQKAVADLAQTAIDYPPGLWVHQRLILGREIGEDVHAGGIVPDEKRLAISLGLVHEAIDVLDKLIVNRSHVVLVWASRLPALHALHVGEWRQRSIILNFLLAYRPPSWH